MSVVFDLQNIATNIPPVVKKFDPSYITRYVIVAELVNILAKKSKKPLKILDLGGYNGAARILLPGHDITILDVADDNNLENYVKASGAEMPFSSGEFDVVISCDTLEHIPIAERDAFIREMLRVSKDYCFIGAPFASPDVEAAELNSDTFYKGLTSGGSYIWLKEHAEYGLPKKPWLESMLSGEGVNFTSFDHTSLNVWALMLRANFFLAENIKAVNPKVGKLLLKANNDYLEHYTFSDFPKNGYRTFYVISKHNEIDVKVPIYNRTANQAFMNKLFELLGSSMRQLTADYGTLTRQMTEGNTANQDLSNTNQSLKIETQQLKNQLSSIMNSKSYKAALKLSSAKHRLSRIKP